MEDFFKQFRDNLERRPLPAFEEQDWLDMEKRLRQKESRRPVFLAWQWLAWPLLLLSLGANVVLFHSWRSPLQQNDAVLPIQRDTVYQTRWLYKTDTVVRTVLVPARFPEIKPMRPFFAPAISGKVESEGTLALTIPPTEWQEPAMPQPSENQPTESMPAPPPLLPSTLHLPPSTFNLQPSPFLSEIPIEPVTHRRRMTLQQHLYAMRPKGFRAGITGGWAYPFDKRLQQRGGYTAGLEANIEFSPQLRMSAGAAYFNIRFTTDRMDAAIGIPDIAPPSPDFTFVEAEALRPSLEYAAGMQYFFRASKRFKPFLGLGYGAISMRPYEVIYEFENQPLGVEWSFEKTINRNEFLADLLLLQTGFEYEIFKKWHWQLRATYRTDLKKSGVLTSDQLRVQTGLMRRF